MITVESERTTPKRAFSPLSSIDGRRVRQQFYGTAVLSSLTAMTIGLCGLLAWNIPGVQFSSQPLWSSIILTPEAAFAFMVLGSGLFLRAERPTDGRVQWAVALSGLAVTVLSVRMAQALHVLDLASACLIATLLWTSLSVMFLPLARFLDGRSLGNFFGYVILFLFMANVAVLLSYLYGTSLFLGETWQLPSLTSAAASVAVTLALIAIRGPRQIPLRPLMGFSVRARLLRTFLPVAAAAVVIHSILEDTIFSHLNPVVSMTLTAFLSMAIACFMVVRSSDLVSYQIERAVRESEERFGVLVESLEDYAICMLDPGGYVVTWNAGAERIIGYRAQDIIGEHFSSFYDREEVAAGLPAESLKQAITYGAYSQQGWRSRKDGTRFWADVTITPLLDDTGKLRAYANITRDITERKKAEEALRQKTSFVHMLQVVSSAANEASTIEQAMQIGLEQVCNQTGWAIGHGLLLSQQTNSLESSNWLMSDPARYGSFKELVGSQHFNYGEGLPGQVMASGTPLWIRDVTQDQNFRRRQAAKAIGLKGGYAFPIKVGTEVVAVLEFFSEEPGEANEPLLEVMTHIGTQLGRVVERVRLDAALRESEMRFRSVAQSANDAIVSCNTQGLIIAWNKGARTIFGYAEEEILGTSLTQIVPEALKILSPNTKDLLLSGPQSVFGRTIESVGKEKNGQEFPIELSIADWKVGEDIFFTAFIRNILKRKETEAHISASLREKEVLLKEIHHRVKNNLQIISSLLRLQSQHITDGHTLDMFRESQNRVQSMALIHEYLYQSRDMARINFHEYIRNLTSHLFRSYGVTPETVVLTLQVDETPLDLDTAIPCGLIITELVSNALKHAFPNGCRGKLAVNFHATGPRQFELVVQDNGAGIPPSVDLDKTESLGLRLVRTLTKQLAGEIHIRVDQGTQFTIALNNAQK